VLFRSVGFIRKLPTQLIESFKSTLDEVREADLLLHVVDSSSPTAWQQMEAVDLVLNDLECSKIPQLALLNKMDIADDASTVELLVRNRGQSVRVSAKTGEGLDRLQEQVLTHMKHETVSVTVLIPHADGKLLAEIDRMADVRERTYVDDGIEIEMRMNRSIFMQLRGRYDGLHVISGDLSALNPSDEDF